MPTCPRCDRPLPAGARFCSACGAGVEAPGRASAELTETTPPLASPSDPSSPHGRFLPGQMLSSRYRIVGLLGRGGMGEVYRADDLELGQSIALKFLPEKVARDARALDRFRGEVRTARQVAHANVCRVYDIAEMDGHVFLSMEYIDGEDLSHALRRLGRPSREKAIEIARQLCLGLAAAHENGVLHRDLKPANVMIDGRGRVRITDFGLAGLADELAATPERAGTPAYMAPEQLESGKVSVRSDIYSLGLILYEVFTGKRAFAGESLEELRQIRASGSVPTPSSPTESLDAAVERVILRCLEADPQGRPRSVYAVLSALPGGDPLAAALAAGETPSPELVANAAVEGGLKPSVAIALLLAVVVLAIGSAAIQTRIAIPPEKARDVLSAQAQQILEDLGYRDLPKNTVSGYEVNDELLDWLRAHPQTGTESIRANWRPVYAFWRRWSPGSLETNQFHGSFRVTLNDPPQALPGSASVVLDSSGRLLGLSVVPERAASAAAATGPDWSVLLQRAGISESDLMPAGPTRRPFSYSDEVVAWRVEKPEDQGGPFTVQAGAVGGHPNYFEIVGLFDGVKAPGRWRGLALFFNWIVFIPTVMVAAIFLAWRNVRLGRVDRKSAFRCALVMLVLYALVEVLSIRIHERLGILQIIGLLFHRPGGHAVLHALNVWVMYLAIEPYVRRIWPRMLVGMVRLLSGRLRDPLVGREILIGTVAGLGVVAFGTVADLLVRHAGLGGGTPHLPTVDVGRGPQLFARSLVFAFAGPWLGTAINVTGLLAMRLATGRTWAAAVLGAVLIGVSSYDPTSGPAMPLAIVAWCAVLGIVTVLMFTRVGLLAALIMNVMILFPEPTTTDLTAWYGPYALASFVGIFAIASYGFWLTLAGQRIFKDILAPERPARA